MGYNILRKQTRRSEVGIFNWRDWWPSDKNPANGKAKPSGGKAGSGRVADTPSGNNAKKTVVPKNRRGMDGRVK
jgi:hypothetical protein